MSTPSTTGQVREPSPGDITLIRGNGGTIFIYRTRAAERPLWLASSTVLLRVRAVTDKGGGNYRPAPDFTVDRVFHKGQAWHLIRKYFPDALQSSGERILLFHTDGGGFYAEAPDLAEIPMRNSKTKNA